MTPEPKKRIFDEQKFDDIIYEKVGGIYTSEQSFEERFELSKDFIESEQRRFARECLEKVRPTQEPLFDGGNEEVTRYWEVREEIEKQMRDKIDALIKELE